MCMCGWVVCLGFSDGFFGIRREFSDRQNGWCDAHLATNSDFVNVFVWTELVESRNERVTRLLCSVTATGYSVYSANAQQFLTVGSSDADELMHVSITFDLLDTSSEFTSCSVSGWVSGHPFNQCEFYDLIRMILYFRKLLIFCCWRFNWI